MVTAFIPARAGSKRVERKNIRAFFDHPLIAYAIQGAIDSCLFDGIYVSSDSEEIGFYAEHYGATFVKRPAEFATDTSPDAEWIEHLQQTSGRREQFAILRPTSPFRTGDTIRLAYAVWDKVSHMKAVEPVKQRPEKMWHVFEPLVHRENTWIQRQDGKMLPFWDSYRHLLPSQSLSPVYVQNGSLEFRADGQMDGYQPFFTQGYEGFDLNTPEDWILAEALVERGLATLPKIERSYCAPPF